MTRSQTPAIVPARSHTRARAAASFAALTKTKGEAERSAPAVPAPFVAMEPMQPHELAVIEAARAILRARLAQPGAALTSPSDARLLASLHLASLDHECFAVMYLDAQNRVIDFDVMFRGTLTATSVYPREIVRAALARGATAVILAHNHPSGCAEPSRADEYLTQTLKTTLALVDVRVLDHLVVGGDSVMSFAERGLL